MMFPVRIKDHVGKNWYIVWGTISQQPVTRPMDLPDFLLHYRSESGEKGEQMVREWLREIQQKPYYFGPIYGSFTQYDEAMSRLMESCSIEHSGEVFDLEDWKKDHRWKLNDIKAPKETSQDFDHMIGHVVTWNAAGSKSKNALVMTGKVMAFIPFGEPLTPHLPPEALTTQGLKNHLVKAPSRNFRTNRLLVSCRHPNRKDTIYRAPFTSWVTEKGGF